MTAWCVTFDSRGLYAQIKMIMWCAHDFFGDTVKLVPQGQDLIGFNVSRVSHFVIYEVSSI
jgi:hypothetical protein